MILRVHTWAQRAVCKPRTTTFEKRKTPPIDLSEGVSRRDGVAETPGYAGRSCKARCSFSKALRLSGTCADAEIRALIRQVSDSDEKAPWSLTLWHSIADGPFHLWPHNNTGWRTPELASAILCVRS